MTRQAIIERTIQASNQLPEDKAEEISDFADFVINVTRNTNLMSAFNNWAIDTLHSFYSEKAN